MTPTKPRLTKRAIPRNLEQWERERAGVRRFLSNLATITDPMMLEWRRKMSRYYRRRLRDLNANPPRGHNRKARNG